MAGDLFEVVEPRPGAKGAEAASGQAAVADAAAAGDRTSAGDRAATHDAATSGDQRTGGATIVLRVHVQPGAGRSSVVGRYGDSLHLRVAAPPVDGRATAATAELVASLLDVPKSSVTLVSGDRSREKRFMIKDIDVDAVRSLIDSALEDAAERAGARTSPHPPKSRRRG
jgi:uncharacterized protein (TIGR00251 family)